MKNHAKASTLLVAGYLAIGASGCGGAREGREDLRSSKAAIAKDPFVGDATEQEGEQRAAFTAALTIDGVQTSVHQILASRCSVCHAQQGQAGVVFELGDPLKGWDSLVGRGLNAPQANLIPHYMGGQHQVMAPPFTTAEVDGVGSWLSLYVAPPPPQVAPTASASPVCSLVANPDTVFAGSAATLSYTANADVVTADLDGQPIVLDGAALPVTPVTTTAFVLTVADSQGITATCSATVTVNALPPPPASGCTLTGPATVVPGDLATLVLVTAAGTSSASIDNTMVQVTGGTKDVTPDVAAASTTYSATAVTPAGPTTCAHTVALKTWAQMTKDEAYRAKMPVGTTYASVDDMISRANGCRQCHGPVAYVHTNGMSFSMAQSWFQLAVADAAANLATIKRVVNPGNPAIVFRLHLPNVGGKATPVSDLDDFVSAPGLAKHKSPYYPGHTAAERTHIISWVDKP